MTDPKLQNEIADASAHELAPTSSGGALPGILEVSGMSDDRDETARLLSVLVDGALDGTVVWDRNVVRTIEHALGRIDALVSQQLAAVMHHPELQKLEGSWRGLKHLVFNSETSESLQIRVLNADKTELKKDFDKAVDFDQSHLWKSLYTRAFDQAGGVPFGALVGDFEFTHGVEDVELLRNISSVCAAAFCPFIAAAGPAMFQKDWDSYADLENPVDIASRLRTEAHTKWKQFRETDDSRFVSLVLPRVMSRLPYGKETSRVEEFDFEEFGHLHPDVVGTNENHGRFTWMNASYVMGARLADSFAKFGWCTSIRGADSGGRVEKLPLYTYMSAHGDERTKCPTEARIADGRGRELSNCGFLPLVHYEDSDYAVFFDGQTTQRPATYDTDDANENARLSAGLPYMMASSRIAHYLKVMARDRLGSKAQRGDVERLLRRWLNQYVCKDSSPPEEMKARFPLAAAEVEVRERPGAPGVYDAVAWIRPWLFLEELNASLRLVASMPEGRGGG